MARIHQDWHKSQVAPCSSNVAQFPALPECQSGSIETEALTAVPEDGRMEKQLQKIIADRRFRQTLFSADLFADPAWDILLELALAEKQQTRVCVTDLCTGAQVPQTTALRWINHLTECGWLVRKNDRLDGRRKFIELSEVASLKMTAFLTAIDGGTA